MNVNRKLAFGFAGLSVFVMIAIITMGIIILVQQDKTAQMRAELTQARTDLAQTQAELARAQENISLVRAEYSWKLGIEARMADKMALLAYLMSIKYPIENDPAFLLEHPELIQINSEERSIAWPTRNGSRKLGGLDWFPSAPR